MGTTVLTTGLGNSGTYPTNLVALERRAVGMFNGYDKNQFYWLPKSSTGQIKQLGIAAPAAAPTLASQASGALTGTFRYRVRWIDSETNTVSAPSAELSVTSTAQKNTITRPSNSGIAARITHWVLERTANLGQVFYPVNTSSANPYGTAIGTTTYQDNTADNDAFTFAATYTEYAGKVRPYPIAFMNGDRLFLGGSITHTTTATLTNSSASVTAASALTQDMEGAVVRVGSDSTFEKFEFLAYGSASTFTLSSTWGGTTNTYTLYITLPGNRVAWSEQGFYEYFGKPVINGLTNEVFIGNKAKPVLGCVGFGNIGGVYHALYAKRDELYLHSYTLDPAGTAGGTIHQLPARRGCIGDRAIFVLEGTAYGIDDSGIWRYRPNGNIDEMALPLKGDWRSKRWDFSQGAKFWIQWRPEIMALAFYMVEAGQSTSLMDGTEANVPLLWDLRNEKWLGNDDFVVRRTCGDVAPDKLGQLRAMSYGQESSSAASINSACQAHEIADAEGVIPGTALGENITTVSIGGTFIQVAGTPWTASALVGITARVLSATNLSDTVSVISANTTSKLTLSPWPSPAPIVGDAVWVGGIKWQLRTARLDLGQPMRVKEFVQMRCRLRSKANVPGVLAKVYYSGLSMENTPDTDRSALSEDGVTQLSGANTVIIGGQGWVNFRLPLNEVQGYDVQFDLHDFTGAEPAELMAGMEVIARVDDSVDPEIIQVAPTS